MQIDEEECVTRTVMAINTRMKGAYVFSSGRNMGVFKAVGYPEDVGYFYRLDEYEAYSWTAHGRYPTNTPGWWGGAHPFALLNYSVVHNGEISSYDAVLVYHCPEAPGGAGEAAVSPQGLFQPADHRALLHRAGL